MIVKQPDSCRIMTTDVSTSPTSANLRIDERGADGVHLDDLAAHDEAGEVEVVDRHVEEHAARAGDVLDRRRVVVAARDLDGPQVAELTARRGALHGLMAGVEASVEADLQQRAGVVDRRDRLVDRGEVERDRLLAERRLARPCRGDDQLGVGTGRRADRHRVGVALEHVVDRCERRHPESGGDVRGRGRNDVEDAVQRRAGNPIGDELGVHAADPATPEHCDTNGVSH